MWEADVILFVRRFFSHLEHRATQALKYRFTVRSSDAGVKNAPARHALFVINYFFFFLQCSFMESRKLIYSVSFTNIRDVNRNYYHLLLPFLQIHTKVWNAHVIRIYFIRDPERSLYTITWESDKFAHKYIDKNLVNVESFPLRSM